jgi:hypothetical protein
MRRYAGRWPRFRALYGAGLGFAGGIVATIAASLDGLTDPLSAPVLMVVVVAATTTVPGAILAGLQSWLLYASFIIGHAGALALNAASIQAAVVLVGAAVLATAAGGAIRWIQRPQLAPIPVPREPVYQDSVKKVGGRVRTQY